MEELFPGATDVATTFPYFERELEIKQISQAWR